jgi:hypothetical protein
MPDWRITCIFVDRDCRKKDLSFDAVCGALELSENLGGGLYDVYKVTVTTVFGFGLNEAF